MVEAVLRGEGLRDLDHVGEGIRRRWPRSRARLCRNLQRAPSRLHHGQSSRAPRRGGLVMTPTAQDLRNACSKALATPARPEEAGVFASARARLVALINHLVELEHEDATHVRMRENAALREVVTAAGPAHGIPAKE